MRNATKFETLRVLYSLWRKGEMETAQVRHLLITSCLLQLTSLTNEGITAETPDGKIKYKLK